LAFWFVNQKRYNTLLVRSPFSYYLALKDYKAEHQEIKKERLMLGKEAYTNEDSLIVVFVLGEALRADHIQMNGYHRATMPKMEDRGVISFPKIFSPFTHTAQSLPYILTRANQDSLAPQFSESSFIDIFKNSSFYASWIGNQNPTRTYRFFVSECDTIIINKPQFSDYSNVKKMDSDLIEPFENMVTSSKTKQLINIHLIGNHWWYNSNFPDTFAVFTPILQNKTISPSNRERMINSYDNATLFTDYVLDKMIESIEDKSSMLIFLSDHGQSFGENGKWLHANNNPPEQNPACFIWLSEKYKEKYPAKHEALISNKNMIINSSFLFHTIIDGGSISSKYLNLNQSLFSSEFQPEKEDIDLEKE
jgi:glucan phosphoethanolaminetransferase (alkaline phosphatase superfamily)